MNKFQKFFAVALALAAALTFSCSSSEDSGLGNIPQTSREKNPLAETKWYAENSQPSPYNTETINFYSNKEGYFSYYIPANGNSYSKVSKTFTYTISENTVTISEDYMGYSSFAYGGEELFVLAGVIFKKN